ncbi:MAG: hypothetical protein OSA98_11495 [Rubripirellula sp.]|nr:hypothetical protein [Rubripirellula sp.]
MKAFSIARHRSMGKGKIKTSKTRTNDCRAMNASKKPTAANSQTRIWQLSKMYSPKKGFALNRKSLNRKSLNRKSRYKASQVRFHERQYHRPLMQKGLAQCESANAYHSEHATATETMEAGHRRFKAADTW